MLGREARQLSAGFGPPSTALLPESGLSTAVIVPSLVDRIWRAAGGSREKSPVLFLPPTLRNTDILTAPLPTEQS
ncbi:hypothetical protein SKAU_G00134830 [Synaphobranchus kaupii]|uniref:Uncharacterized protein n=1 Tax=Synaphobranchus kaupii TaxID=118154 RepID=A0A9Q1J1K3_SYNKA|nr:hypothetical protein SKAU_G00134830 [Synaphobranchus kaupii]